MKQGWKSSECWHTAIAQGLALCTIFGIVNSGDTKTLEDAIGKCITAVFAICANGYVVIQYIKGRLHLKTIDNDRWNIPEQGAKASVLPFLVPFLITSSTALVLLLSGSPAQAQSIFPWRNNISQKIAQHESDINNLKNKPAPQAPQASPPQIIVMPPQYPPLQSYPIQGQPQQVFPIQGQPKQDFPIQGQPKQELPIQGQPQQQLPIQGQPQQVLPIQGQPQPLPIAPQTPTPQLQSGGPQQYSIQRAIWITK